MPFLMRKQRCQIADKQRPRCPRERKWRGLAGNQLSFPRKTPAPASKTALAGQGSFLHGAGLIPGAAALPVCAEPAAPGLWDWVPKETVGAYLASALPSWMEGFLVAEGD